MDVTLELAIVESIALANALLETDVELEEDGDEEDEEEIEEIEEDFKVDRLSSLDDVHSSEMGFWSNNVLKSKDSKPKRYSSGLRDCINIAVVMVNRQKRENLKRCTI